MTLYVVNTLKLVRKIPMTSKNIIFVMTLFETRITNNFPLGYTHK